MSDDTKHDITDSLVESAMRRLDGRLPDSVAADDRKERERQDLGRRNYDVALANRLQQLRNATGKDALVMPPAFQSAAAPEPALQSRGFQAGTLLITALIAAAAGAGAMWLSLGGNPRFAAKRIEITSAPPSATHVVAQAVQAAPPVPAAAPVPPLADEEAVSAAIDSWRAAWASRNVEVYLACYSADFTPANGQTHDAWLAARRKNISTRSDIAVKTNELKLERLDAQRMKAHFLQDYAAGSYRETAQPKTLLLVRDEAGWKIAGEWQGEAPASALGKY